LILVGIGVILSPIQLLFTVVPMYKPIFEDGTWEALTTVGSEAYNSLYAPLLLGEITFNSIMIAASIYLIYLFFSKHYLFPKLYICIATFSIVVIPLDAWFVTKVFPSEPMFDSETTKDFMRALVAGVIWIPYMLISKRVKATFVESKSNSTYEEEFEPEVMDEEESTKRNSNHRIIGTKEEAHLKTIVINEAYRTLSSKDTKNEYDKLRAKNSNDNFSDEELSSFNSNLSTDHSSKERSIEPYKLLRGVNWVFSAFLFFGIAFLLISAKGTSLISFVALAFLLIIPANFIGTAFALNPGVNIMMGMPIIIQSKSATVYALLIMNSLFGLFGIAMIISGLYALQYGGSIYGSLWLFLSFANTRALWELKKA